MALVDHARKELALLDNDAEFNESLIKAIEGFASYGHSGGSAPIAIAMLTDLLWQRNLSPLTDDPDEWVKHSPDMWDGVNGVWQNTRNGEAFSNDEGKTHYLLSEGANDQRREPIHYSYHKEKEE